MFYYYYFYLYFFNKDNWRTGIFEVLATYVSSDPSRLHLKEISSKRAGVDFDKIVILCRFIMAAIAFEWWNKWESTHKICPRYTHNRIRSAPLRRLSWAQARIRINMSLWYLICRVKLFRLNLQRMILVPLIRQWGLSDYTITAQAIMVIFTLVNTARTYPY